MSRHRANDRESALIRALRDFDDACRTAGELYRRGREGRADWALVRAGRRVAAALGVTFEDHPLGDLVYVEPFKITPADIAREQRARQALASTISGAECAPGLPTGASGGVPDRAPVPVERPTTSAPESDSQSVAS